MPSRSAGGKSWSLQGFCFSNFLGWPGFFTWWRRRQKDFWPSASGFISRPFGRQLATFDWTPCFETVTKQHVFSNQAASPPDIYKKTSSEETITKPIRISRFTPFPLATFEIYWSPIFGQLWKPRVFRAVLVKETLHLVRFGPFFRRRTAWCFAPIRRRCHGSQCLKAWPSSIFSLHLPVFKWIESHI